MILGKLSETSDQVLKEHNASLSYCSLEDTHNIFLSYCVGCPDDLLSLTHYKILSLPDHQQLLFL